MKKIMRRSSRALSMLLAVIMVFTMIPANVTGAYAAEVGELVSDEVIYSDEVSVEGEIIAVDDEMSEDSEVATDHEVKEESDITEVDITDVESAAFEETDEIVEESVSEEEIEMSDVLEVADEKALATAETCKVKINLTNGVFYAYANKSNEETMESETIYIKPEDSSSDEETFVLAKGEKVVVNVSCLYGYEPYYVYSDYSTGVEIKKSGRIIDSKFEFDESMFDEVHGINLEIGAQESVKLSFEYDDESLSMQKAEWSSDIENETRTSFKVLPAADYRFAFESIKTGEVLDKVSIVNVFGDVDEKGNPLLEELEADENGFYHIPDNYYNSGKELSIIADTKKDGLFVNFVELDAASGPYDLRAYEASLVVIDEKGNFVSDVTGTYEAPVFIKQGYKFRFEIETDMSDVVVSMIDNTKTYAAGEEPEWITLEKGAKYYTIPDEQIAAGKDITISVEGNLTGSLIKCEYGEGVKGLVFTYDGVEDAKYSESKIYYAEEDFRFYPVMNDGYDLEKVMVMKPETRDLVKDEEGFYSIPNDLYLLEGVVVAFVTKANPVSVSIQNEGYYTKPFDVQYKIDSSSADFITYDKPFEVEPGTTVEVRIPKLADGVVYGGILRIVTYEYGYEYITLSSEDEKWLNYKVEISSATDIFFKMEYKTCNIHFDKDMPAKVIYHGAEIYLADNEGDARIGEMFYFKLEVQKPNILVKSVKANGEELIPDKNGEYSVLVKDSTWFDVDFEEITKSWVQILDSTSNYTDISFNVKHGIYKNEYFEIKDGLKTFDMTVISKNGFIPVVSVGPVDSSTPEKVEALSTKNDFKTGKTTCVYRFDVSKISGNGIYIEDELHHSKEVKVFYNKYLQPGGFSINGQIVSPTGPAVYDALKDGVVYTFEVRAGEKLVCKAEVSPWFKNKATLDRIVDDQNATLRTKTLKGSEYYFEIAPNFGAKEPGTLDYEIYGKPLYKQTLYDNYMVRNVWPEKNVYYITAGTGHSFYAYVEEDVNKAELVSFTFDGEEKNEALSYEPYSRRVRIDASKLVPGSRHTLVLKYKDYAGKEIVSKFVLQVYADPTAIKLNGKASGTAFKQVPGSGVVYKLSAAQNVDLNRIICTSSEALVYGYGNVRVDMPSEAITVTFKDKVTGEELSSFKFEPDETSFKKLVPAIKFDKAQTNEKQLVFETKVTIPKSAIFVNGLKLQIKGKKLKGGDKYKDDIELVVNAYPGTETYACDICEDGVDVSELTEPAEYEITACLLQVNESDEVKFTGNSSKPIKVQNKLTYINDKLTLSKSKLTLNANSEANIKVKINDKATVRDIEIVSMNSDNEKYIEATYDDELNCISLKSGMARNDYTAKYIVRCGGASANLEVNLKGNNSVYVISTPKSAYYKPVGKAIKIPVSVYERNISTGKEKKVSAKKYMFDLFSDVGGNITIDKNGVITVPKYISDYYGSVDIGIELYSSAGEFLNTGVVEVYFNKLTPYEFYSDESYDINGDVSIYSCQSRIMVYDNVGIDCSYDDAKYVNRYTYSSTGALKLGKNGEVISVKPGKATITAKAKDGSSVVFKRTIQLYGNAYNSDKPDFTLSISTAEGEDGWREKDLRAGTNNVYTAYKDEELRIEGNKAMKISIDGAKNVSVKGADVHFVPDKANEKVTVSYYDYYGNIKECTYDVTFNIIEKVNEIDLVYKGKQTIDTYMGTKENYKWEVKNIEGLAFYKPYYLSTYVAPGVKYDRQRTPLESYLYEYIYTPYSGWAFSLSWENGKLFINLALDENNTSFEMGTAKIDFILTDEKNNDVGIKRGFVFDPFAGVQMTKLPDVSIANTLTLEKDKEPVSIFAIKDGLMYEPEIEGIVVNGVRINQDLADALCGTLDFDESDSENMFYYFNMKYIDEEIYNAYKGKTVELLIKVMISAPDDDEDNFKNVSQRVKVTIK